MNESQQTKVDLALMLAEASVGRALTPQERDNVIVATLLDGFAILDEHEKEVA